MGFGNGKVDDIFKGDEWGRRRKGGQKESSLEVMPSSNSRSILLFASAILNVILVYSLMNANRVPCSSTVQSFLPTTGQNSHPVSKFVRGPLGGAKHKVVLFTAIFGPAHNASHLPFFFRSVEKSGFDVIVLGDPPVPFPMPSNVRQIHMSWPDFADLVSLKLFDGKPLNKLKNTVFYKIIDFKPTFGFLFQEYIAQYDFWGYCDNDMLLGHASSFLTKELLNSHDIITAYEGPNGEKTWGPFTLMRNSKKINELFRLTEFGIHSLFDSYFTYFFDEWGGANWEYYNRSMTQIVHEHGQQQGVRWHGGFPIGWDGECGHINQSRCSECTLSTDENDESHLMWDRSLINPEAQYKKYEVLLCHYQFGKSHIRDQMNKMSAKEIQVLQTAEPLFYSFPEGFRSK